MFLFVEDKVIQMYNVDYNDASRDTRVSRSKKYRDEAKCSKKIITLKKYYKLESWKQIIDFIKISLTYNHTQKYKNYRKRSF